MRIRYQRTPGQQEEELRWLCNPKRMVLSFILSILIIVALLCYEWPEEVGLQPHQPATAKQYILQKNQYVQLSPRAYPPYKVCQHLDVVLEGPQGESPGTTIWERQANGQGRDEVLVTLKGFRGTITGISLDPTVWFMGPNNSLAIHTSSQTGGSVDGTYVAAQNGKRVQSTFFQVVQCGTSGEVYDPNIITQGNTDKDITITTGREIRVEVDLTAGGMREHEAPPIVNIAHVHSVIMCIGGAIEIRAGQEPQQPLFVLQNDNRTRADLALWTRNGQPIPSYVSQPSGMFVTSKSQLIIPEATRTCAGRYKPEWLKETIDILVIYCAHRTIDPYPTPAGKSPKLPRKPLNITIIKVRTGHKVTLKPHSGCNLRCTQGNKTQQTRNTSWTKNGRKLTGWTLDKTQNSISKDQVWTSDTGLYAVTVKGGAKVCNESAVYLQVDKMIAYSQSQLGNWVSVRPNQALITTATQGQATIVCDMRTISESVNGSVIDVYKAATVSWSPDTRLQIEYNHTFVIGEEWFSVNKNSPRPGTRRNTRVTASSNTTTPRVAAGHDHHSLRKRRAVDITTWQTEQRYQNDPNSFVSMAAKVAYNQKSQQQECYVCSLLPVNSIEGFPLMGAPITACDLCKIMNTTTDSECQNMTLVHEPQWSEIGCKQVKKSVTCPSPPKITALFRVVGQAMWCIEGTGNDTSPFLGNLECPPLTQDYFEENTCANNQSRQSWLQSILTKTPVKVPKNMRWSCGSIGFSYLPPLGQWRGKCSLFYITPAMRVTKRLPSIERFEQHLTAVGVKRAKRDVEAKYAWDHNNDPFFTHHQTSVSRFFGALLPSYGVMQALDQIRDLSNITYELANRTATSISLMQQQLGETTKMTVQNRMAMDQMLAAQGGVCKIIGPECCTYIPDNSVSVERQQEAIWQLAWKAKPAPLSSGPFSWLRALFNSWGQEIIEGIVAFIVFVVIGFILFQCCMMCVKLCMNKLTTGFTTNIMINHRVAEPETESVYEDIPSLFVMSPRMEDSRV